METEAKVIKIINKSEIDYKTLLEKIYVISSKIHNDQDQILQKLNQIETRVLNIEKYIEISTKLLNNDKDENLKELKSENLTLEKKEVFKALSYKDYRSIIHVFKYVYKNKHNGNYVYPIRITGKRSYEYYDNSKWNPDLYGHHSMNTLCLNMQNLFIQHNNIDELTSEDFLLNQNFIYKLSEEKYKKEIFKNIIEEVRINNN